MFRCLTQWFDIQQSRTTTKRGSVSWRWWVLAVIATLAVGGWAAMIPREGSVGLDCGAVLLITFNHMQMLGIRSLWFWITGTKKEIGREELVSYYHHLSPPSLSLLLSPSSSFALSLLPSFLSLFLLLARSLALAAKPGGSVHLPSAPTT